MKHFIKLLFTFSLTIFLALFTIPSFADSVQLQNLEASSDGTLGVYALNTANNQIIQYRANQRFAFCSTSKFIVVAAILKESMTHPDLLQQKLTYTQRDIISYSPVTKKNIGTKASTQMTVADLCAATLLSDTTAMNLLIKKLGGLEAVNKFTHSIGDHTFRLDRWEPNINTAIPGDPRDTTTPKAMAQDLQTLVLGNILAPTQRQLLQTWMKNNNTGDLRIRAGTPKGWVVADKTGSGDYGTTNDIGVIWPPHCPPIVLTIYFTQKTQDAPYNNNIIAAATRTVIKEFAQTDQCLKADRL